MTSKRSDGSGGAIALSLVETCGAADKSSSRAESFLVDDAVEKWLDFLAFCFSEKGTPRAYFQRHVEADPSFSPDQIFVVVDARSGDFLSTCRVFHREVYLGGTPVTVGGLGEVCTHPEHRRKGHAQLCLDRALAFMTDAGYDLSLLHTSKAHLQAYYGKSGYRSCPTEYKTISFTLADDAVDEQQACVASSDVIEWATYPQHLDDVRALHEHLGNKHHGIVVRDEAYWRRWIQNELNAIAAPSFRMAFFGDGAGYAFLQHRPVRGDEVVQVREVGFSSAVTQQQAALFIFRAATQFWQEIAKETNKKAVVADEDSPSRTTSIKINIATPLLPLHFMETIKTQLSRELDHSLTHIREIVDKGWMYRIIDRDSPRLKQALVAASLDGYDGGPVGITQLHDAMRSSSQPSRDGAVEEIDDINSSFNHVFLSLDAF